MVEGVDWAQVDIRLAVAEGPEGKKRRDELFGQLDPNKNRSLSLSELQGGVPHFLEAASSAHRKTGDVAEGLIPGVTDFKPAIKQAFKIARQMGNRPGSDSHTVDRTEFHPFLVFFRNYLELLVLFDCMDEGEDAMLSMLELMPNIRKLKPFGITVDKIKAKLKNEPDGEMSFDHFAEWCLRDKIKDLQFDESEGADDLPVVSNASPSNAKPASRGKIDWAVVDERIPTAAGAEASARRDELFQKMDTVKSGSLTLTDVQASMCYLFEGEKQDRKKGEAAQSILPGIRDTRPAVKSAFLAARDLAPSVKKTKFSRQDDTVDRKEFHALLVYLRHYLELQILFQDLDTSEDLRISKEECQGALPLLAGWGIDKVAVNKMFSEVKGEVKFAKFADWCLKLKLKGQAFDVLEDEAEQPEQVDGQTEVLEVAGNVVDCNDLTQASNEDVELSQAAVKIQAIQRGKKERQEVQQIKARKLQEVSIGPGGYKKLVEVQDEPLKATSNDPPQEMQATLSPRTLQAQEAERNGSTEQGAFLQSRTMKLQEWEMETARSNEAPSGHAATHPGGTWKEAPRDMYTPERKAWKAKPFSSSCGTLPMESTGVLKRAAHLTTLSHIRSLPKFKFGEKRPCTFLDQPGKGVPGCGTYEIVKTEKTSKSRASASFGMGGDSRFGIGIQKPHPAPGQYGIPRHPTLDLSKNYAFSLCSKPKGIRADGPGPGAYELRSTLGGAACTAKGKLPKYYKPTAALPGPGAYTPRGPGCLTHERTAPKVGFGTNTRENYSEIHCQRTPGPGAYDCNTYQEFGTGHDNKYSFKSRIRPPNNFSSYVSPGPGSYDAEGTCFGY